MNINYRVRRATKSSLPPCDQVLVAAARVLRSSRLNCVCFCARRFFGRIKEVGLWKSRCPEWRAITSVRELPIDRIGVVIRRRLAKSRLVAVDSLNTPTSRRTRRVITRRRCRFYRGVYLIIFILIIIVTFFFCRKPVECSPYTGEKIF